MSSLGKVYPTCDEGGIRCRVWGKSIPLVMRAGLGVESGESLSHL